MSEVDTAWAWWTQEREDRFWAKVQKSSPDQCWLWTGSRYSDAPTKCYGIFATGKGLSDRAHRIAYELTYGRVPSDYVVMHTCDNPACVNPQHLRVGTQRENMTDMRNKNRQYVCRGTEVTRAKLTEKDVWDIRVSHANGATFKSLARKYGLSPQGITEACRTGWKHVPHPTATAIRNLPLEDMP